MAKKSTNKKTMTKKAVKKKRTKKDRENYQALLRSVLDSLDSLSHLSHLHLTSIARAIESLLKDKRKIIFRAKPRKEFGNTYPFGVTMTQEYKTHLPGSKRAKTFYEHFILYPRASHQRTRAKDLEKTRFSVAHELGHILMHMPYISKSNKCYVNLEGGLYRVDFTERQEQEADLFAATLCDQRPIPQRPENFHGPCIHKLLELRDAGLFGSSGLDAIMPEDNECMLKKNNRE